MKFLLPLLRNNILQLSHANQLRYADTKNRTKTITLYMLIAAILMGLLAYLIYSLKIIYSIAWSLEEVVTELVVHEVTEVTKGIHKTKSISAPCSLCPQSPLISC